MNERQWRPGDWPPPGVYIAVPGSMLPDPLNPPWVPIVYRDAIGRTMVIREVERPDVSPGVARTGRGRSRRTPAK